MKRRVNKYIEARKRQRGGDYKPSFEEYYKTVPQYKNDTTNYDLRTAYQYFPYEEMKKFATDDNAHLSSVVELPNGNYRFLKSKDHPSLQKELDWYYGNTPEAIKFRNDYDLDKSGNYYQYIKKNQTGMIIQDNMGQWRHPGEITRITGNNGNVPITMQGVNYPVLGVSSNGQKKIMLPGYDYEFDGEYVDEYPMISKNQIGKYLEGSYVAPESTTTALNGINKAAMDGYNAQWISPLMTSLNAGLQGAVALGSYIGENKEGVLNKGISDGKEVKLKGDGKDGYTYKGERYTGPIMQQKTKGLGLTKTYESPMFAMYNDDAIQFDFQNQNDFQKTLLEKDKDFTGQKYNGYDLTLFNPNGYENPFLPNNNKNIMSNQYPILNQKKYDFEFNLPYPDMSSNIGLDSNEDIISPYNTREFTDELKKRYFEGKLTGERNGDDYGIYADPTGWNIGYGHLLKVDGNALKTKNIPDDVLEAAKSVGYDVNTRFTKEQAYNLAQTDWDKKLASAKVHYNQMVGEGRITNNVSWDDLDDFTKNMFAHFEYGIANGIYGYPKFTNAMANKDYDTALKESGVKGDAYKARNEFVNAWIKYMYRNGEEPKSIFDYKKKGIGGNMNNFAEIERWEVVSEENGNLIANSLLDYHNLYTNENENPKNIVSLTNDMVRDMNTNPGLSLSSKRVNKYTSMRRKTPFIFPSTVGRSGILEKKTGTFYPNAFKINSLT